MDKDQLKKLISDKVAGQGSQVDVGGVLPSILEAIIDSEATATIIDCSYSLGSSDFEFSSEQKAALKAAFDNGALSNIILRAEGSGITHYGTVTGAIDAENTLTIVYARPEGAANMLRGTVEIDK